MTVYPIRFSIYCSTFRRPEFVYNCCTSTLKTWRYPTLVLEWAPNNDCYSRTPSSEFLMTFERSLSLDTDTNWELQLQRIWCWGGTYHSTIIIVIVNGIFVTWHRWDSNDYNEGFDKAELVLQTILDYYTLKRHSC